MLNRLILKVINLPVAFHTRWYPRFNRFYFRGKRVRYGENMKILGKTNVVNQGEISIGDNFYMTSGDAINPISSNLHGAFFVEEGAKVVIGNNVGMSSTRVWIKSGLTIGDNVNIGACVLLIDTDTHPIDYIARRTSNEGAKSAPIVIEDDVWIGAHSIVLKGVHIGARSIIGAGSVVTKDIPSDCIAAGNPCKIIRYINTSENT